MSSELKPPPSPRTVQLASAALVFCMAYFLFDIALDLEDRMEVGLAYSTFESMLLIVEFISVGIMAFAIHVLRGQLLFLRRQHQSDAQTLTLLRGHFDRVIAAKFDEWKLSQAERDVTLLILKGMPVASIAAARGTAPGTVKAQSTAIFRKIGVASKSELLSLFMDEFLDSGSSEAAAA